MMQVLTANRLLEGDAVFWTHSGWNTLIGPAQIARTAEEADSLHAIAQLEVQACRVVEPYLIDIVQQNESITPLHYRERMRTAGPTVRRDLGKQSQAA